MANIHDYPISVTWSAPDREFVATAAGFPSLSHLAPTPDKAAAGMLDLLTFVLADMEQNGEPLPMPTHGPSGSRPRQFA